MWLQLDTDLLSQPRWLNCSLPARMWYLHLIAHCIESGTGQLDRHQWQSTRAMRGKLCLLPNEYPELEASHLLDELASPATHLIDMDDDLITVRGFDKRYQDTVVKKNSQAERQKRYRDKKKRRDEQKDLRDCYDELPASDIVTGDVTSRNGSVTVASLEEDKILSAVTPEREEESPPIPPRGECPEPKTASAKGRTCTSLPIAIPEQLKGLKLYEADAKLCARWEELYETWTTTYPGLDIMHEVRKAHAWEIENPANRKVQRSRFLGNWIRRNQDNPRVKKTEHPIAKKPIVWRDEDGNEYELGA